MRMVLVLTMLAILAPLSAIAAGPATKPAGTASLVVYQDLDEMTSRIPRLASRPVEMLVNDDGFYQTERLIFHDVETGNEVWSLTQDQITDIGNIERRCAWSCNGQYISFIGSKAFMDYNTHTWNKRGWAGNNFIANADGSARRKLWGNDNGKIVLLNDKFNNWDQRKPNVLYYPHKDKLWRVTVSDKDERSNIAEAIYTFPSSEGKIIQEISDDNLMLIEESGKKPNCYIIDLNKDPKDAKFCFTYPLKGEVHPGSFRFRRSAPIVTGGYEDHTLGSITLKLDPEKGWIPYQIPASPYQMKMSHLWFGAPDDRVAFSGEANNTDVYGLWVYVPGSKPQLAAITNDGHPTWCGHDPDWFFYANGTGNTPNLDPRYARRLLAGSADGKTVKIICTPFDRRRGTNEGGYDAIPRPHQSPDATKCWFHSSMLMPTNAFTGSYIGVFRRPYAPTDVQFKDGKLSWTPHKLSYEVKAYILYRQDGDKWVQVGQPVSGTSVAADKDGTYMLTSLEWSGLESSTSSPTITVPTGAKGQPVTGFDKTAPEQVKGFTVAKEGPGQYRLKWTKNDATDLRYYNVYFSSKSNPEVSQKRLITSPQDSVTEYLDWTAPVDGNAFYAITAIDRQGNESKPTYASMPPEAK